MSTSWGPLEKLAAATAPFTGRAKALLAFSALMIVAGSFIPHGEGLIAAGIAGSLLLLVERLVFTYASAAVSKLRINYSIERPLVDGKEARVRIELHNPTRINIEHLEYYDAPPALLKPLVEPQAALSLSPHSTTTIEYPVKLVVGRHHWGSPRLVVGDYLGLFRREYRPKVAFSVTVLPRPVTGRKARGAIVATPQPGGTSSVRRRGVGTEFLELREYNPGDEPRFIDWKATARTNRLMVKVFSQEAVMKVAIVIDDLKSMYRGVVGETKIEYAVRLAAALAEYLARRGDHYRLYFITRGGEVRYTPWLRGHGSSALARAFLARNVEWPRPRELHEESSPAAALGSDEAGGLGPRRYRELAKVLVSTMPRGNAAVIVISDFSESEGRAGAFAEAIKGFRAMHKVFYVLIPVTLMFELKRLSGLAAALYRIEQYYLIRRYAKIIRLLKSRGIPAIATGPDDLLDYVLAKLEHMRVMAA